MIFTDQKILDFIADQADVRLRVQRSVNHVQICQNTTMKYQFSQDYDVDSRYRGLENAVDNAPGKAFAKSYIARGRNARKADITAQRQEDDRFVVAGPGQSLYSFKNSFRASK